MGISQSSALHSPFLIPVDHVNRVILSLTSVGSVAIRLPKML